MKKYLKPTIIISAVALTTAISAQSFEEFRRQQQQLYDDYKSKTEQEFRELRDKTNAQYAELMKQGWIEFDAAPAIPEPEVPEPPTPRIAPEDEVPTDTPIVVDEVVEPVVKEPREEPKPIIYIPEPEPEPEVKPETKPETKPEVKPTAPKITHSSLRFDYYGTECSVELTSQHRYTLSSTKEADVAKVWETLSSSKYDKLVQDCIVWRDRLALNDWGYVAFVRSACDKFWGTKSVSESRLMQMFLLTQSGYKARIARGGEDLYLLLSFDHTVYRYPFLPIDGERFYLIDVKDGVKSFNIFNHEFPDEQNLSLVISQHPTLEAKMSEQRTFTSRRYPDLSVSLSVNRNLIEFYNDFPVSDRWDLYSHASLDERTKEPLYLSLRSYLDGKSELERVNILLDFVQTSLDYKTDDEQFGYERPLFGDESLFYPYCDCEDRSILFSMLVRELVGLDVVLLNYPGHLATAVRFNEQVKGDYITVEGGRYTICDPTYIGASAGLSMPEYKTAKISVVRL